jgi:asparagine synthase (glutamine-hydrolysing)
MAGIAGITGAADSEATIETMLQRITHRGPDMKTVHREGKCTAGVCASRLSKARGNGFARDGDIMVLFDGDIYNQREGEVSDAEVVLDMYRQHGSTFPSYLEGMFACALWTGRELLLARDMVGVRPLFYGKTREGNYCFASEMKALAGIVTEIWELLPATVYSSRWGISGVIPRYPEVRIPDDPVRAAKQYHDCLYRAVERRLEDGAVGGMLLSGGLDSSIIAAVAHEIDPRIPAFTVGVEGAPDPVYAVKMAEFLGIEHHMLTFDVNEIGDLVPRAVESLESFDEDCVSGSIANIFASSFASRVTNCILSGEGGDELNGGYLLLKDLPTETERLRMMERLIEIAYNTAVQRLDRAMMANSINYRTPFLDTEVIAFCLQLPVQWKVHPAENGKYIEKWLLREAFKDMLPGEIYSREKLRFSGGTGTDDHMDHVAEGKIDAGEFNEETRNTPGGYYLNSPKELWYYRIFKEKFPLLAFEKLVGRWDPNK